MRTILKILSILFLGFIVSCNPSSKKEVQLSPEKIEEIKHLKIPKYASDSMKKNFGESARLLSANNINFNNTYELSLDNLAKMLWVPENDEELYDNFRIYLTYDNEIFSSYSDLSTYNKSICLIYSRELNKKEEPKYYAGFSLKDQIEIKESDFKILKENYQKIVKPALENRIDPEKNTDYVIIPRDQLSAYYTKIKLYNDNNLNKINHINVCLAEALDYSGFPKTRELDYLSRKNYTPNQLTLIFDVVTADGSNVEYLSSYDMNSLCPQQCP